MGKSNLDDDLITTRVCVQCERTKSVEDFDRSPHTNRLETTCKQCKTQIPDEKLTPKQILEKMENIKKAKQQFKNLINGNKEESGGKKMKTETIQKSVDKYVDKYGDGFTVKQLSAKCNIEAKALYYQLKKLQDNGELYRTKVNSVLIYFKDKANYKYFNKKKKQDPGYNDNLLKIIREKDLQEKNPDTKIKGIHQVIDDLETMKPQKQEQKDEMIKPGDKVLVSGDRMVAKLPQEQDIKQNIKDMSMGDIILTVLDNKIDYLKEDTKKGVIDLVMEDVKVELTKAVNDLKDELIKEIRDMEKDIAKEVKKDLLRSLLEEPANKGG